MVLEVAMRFEAFSFGSIRIDGVTYNHDVVTDHGEIRKLKKKPSKKFDAGDGRGEARSQAPQNQTAHPSYARGHRGIEAASASKPHQCNPARNVSRFHEL
jgi:hypothetical protein